MFAHRQQVADSLASKTKILASPVVIALNKYADSVALATDIN